MSNLRETIACAAMGHSDEEWANLAASTNPLDMLTVTNSRAIADNVLAAPEIVEALEALRRARINNMPPAQFAAALIGPSDSSSPQQ